MSDGPPWTILEWGQTARWDTWYLVRARGGRQVRVVVPARYNTYNRVRERIELALALLPAEAGADT